MPERKDLSHKIDALMWEWHEHQNLRPVPDPTGTKFEGCGGMADFIAKHLPDLLLPDIDWDALREAIETLTDGPLLREMTRHNAEAFAEAVGMMAGLALRLLALHDKEHP